MKQTPKPAGPAPSLAQLHDAALRHLSRFAATEAGLIRVLDRRIARWARAASMEGVLADEAAAAARRDARMVGRSCVSSGLVDDATFAAARAARLARGGHSGRAVAAHLASKGVAAELVQAALPDPVNEVASALAYTRKRRIGPFRETGDAETRRRDLGALARAGFSREVAEQALRTPSEQADAIVMALRRS
jgi:regulatory protein